MTPIGSMTAHRPRRQVLRLAVNDARIEDALADDDGLIAVDLAKEAAFVTFVARSPSALTNLQKDRVGIAVDVDRLDILHVAALLAFAP